MFGGFGGIFVPLKLKAKKSKLKIMGKIFVIANWKMNPKTFKEASELFESVKKAVKKSGDIKVIICPPALWLKEFNPGANMNLSLGAQNCHWEVSGAYTGELSSQMLADAGAEYVIVGHSERRNYMGESDEVVNLKIKAALRAKLRPILCVGERAGEEMNLVVESQLTKDLAGLSVGQMKEIIVAYEPVWAISTEGGRSCSPDDALSAALFIRKTLTKLYSRFLADKTPIIYGGSVHDGNEDGYIRQARMNGVLVGGASLEAEEFVRIVQNIK